MLIDLLKQTTDLGVFYPAAGRNYPEKYESAYGQNHSSLIYLLTGLGAVPNKATHAGAFLASSTLPVDVVINSWQAVQDTTVYVGHTLDASFAIHSNMTPMNRLIFQWSSTAYAHPDVIQQSFELLSDSNMWAHKDWDVLRPLSNIPPENAPALAEILNVLSYSSIISGYHFHMYKHKSIALNSIVNTWKGKVGFQQ